eukprot:gnl/TRDRNA2_/TRDRNA2_42848_c1_seq1.p2 gnl/TRDRNA2_/TRDRNA2_42848_c1~~gnl/TRDRNA2_/TRDRNA2_42848_c1_seq1.p2  ORF type:complete len:153 (+),score=24.25 gnl/TRDRNA2_/TRDRNA2_42848_c1_seq1:74-532(+)
MDSASSSAVRRIFAYGTIKHSKNLAVAAKQVHADVASQTSQRAAWEPWRLRRPPSPSQGRGNCTLAAAAHAQQGTPATSSGRTLESEAAILYSSILEALDELQAQREGRFYVQKTSLGSERQEVECKAYFYRLPAADPRPACEKIASVCMVG